MWDPAQYQLLDFGDGRRLERFGPLLLDRPCPAAEQVCRAAPQLWTTADARFDREESREWAPSRSARPGNATERVPYRGSWSLRGQPSDTWTITHDRLVFELKRTDFGHVGLFPEQAENWDWLRGQVERRSARLGRPPKVLNLFAYTGGSTLAAAAAGAEVTHVDAARNVVAWARRNAELSSLGAAPIRWIADDALKFVRRELRRGNRYDAVVLDPPSYGHGARGEAWQLDRHLPELLALCANLTAPAAQCVLLTCHTPGYSPPRLRELLATNFVAASGTVVLDAADLVLPASTGQVLSGGAVARWTAE
jgi:23S rRNA (cytosine1962-C5)-methyltransferase